MKQLLARVVATARRWGSHAWMRAATRARSALLDEMLNRRTDAETVVGEIAAEVGMSLNLEDQLAIIAFNHQEYANALAVWGRILPQWRPDQQHFDMQPVIGLRTAAICASKLGHWNDAASFYEQVRLRGGKFKKPGWNIGSRADRAYALWKGHEYASALRVFEDVVTELQALPNKPESFAEFALQKLVGHTLASLASPNSVADYVAGMCSDLSPHKDIGTLTPIAPGIRLVLPTRSGDQS